MTDMDYSGNGQIELWQNGTLLVNWTGAVGYDPTTIPYENPPQGTANPNTKFDVFLGPYRPIQDTEQTEFFDEGALGGHLRRCVARSPDGGGAIRYVRAYRSNRRRYRWQPFQRALVFGWAALGDIVVHLRSGHHHYVGWGDY